MDNRIQLILIIVVGLLVITNVFTFVKVTALGKDTQETTSFAKATHTHSITASSHSHAITGNSHSHDGYGTNRAIEDMQRHAQCRDVSGYFSCH